MEPRSASVPRLVVAGLCGDSGKTVVSLGLLLLARQRGIATAAFKKGPDYIDPMWLSLAARRPCRNLYFHLMTRDQIRAHFARPARAAPPRATTSSPI